jgi:membrane protease YdiL (CAAX protease family)
MPHLTPGRFTILAIATELSLVPLAWGVERLWPGPSFLDSIDWTPRDAWLGALAAVPPVCALLWLLSPRWRDAGFLVAIRRMMRVIAGPTIASLKVYHIVPIALAAGIGEEVLFRGALQDRLGFLLASALFGLLHPFTPAYAALAGLLGAYLGWLQLRQGNLLVPILAHALYDMAALVLMKMDLRAAPREEAGPPPAPPPVS